MFTNQGYVLLAIVISLAIVLYWAAQGNEYLTSQECDSCTKELSDCLDAADSTFEQNKCYEEHCQKCVDCDNKYQSKCCRHNYDKCMFDHRGSSPKELEECCKSNYCDNDSCSGKDNKPCLCKKN